VREGILGDGDDRRTSVVVRGGSMTKLSIDCEIITSYTKNTIKLTMEVPRERFMSMTIYMRYYEVT
jgi:hypothetical protein